MTTEAKDFMGIYTLTNFKTTNILNVPLRSIVALAALSSQITAWRRWCSGIMQDSHSCDPGSIPGRRIDFCYFVVTLMFVPNNTSQKISGARVA